MQAPGWYARLAADPQREAAMAALADRLGLAYERRSKSNARDMKFQLFDTQVATDTTSILTGEIDGLPITAFDHRFFRETTIMGRSLPQTFSCAVTTVPVAAPHLTIEHKLFFRYEGTSDLVVPDVVRTESNEFDRVFRVRCRDGAFAIALLDPSLMGWLLEQGEWNVELRGDRLLCYMPLVPVDKVPTLFTILREFRDRIPHIVRTTGADELLLTAPQRDLVLRRRLGLGPAVLAGCFAIVLLLGLLVALAFKQMADTGGWL